PCDLFSVAVSVEKVIYLCPSQSVGVSAQCCQDVIGDWIAEAIAKDNRCGFFEVVPKCQGSQQVRQFDDLRAIEHRIYQCQPEYLGLSSCGYSSEKPTASLGQSQIYGAPTFPRIMIEIDALHATGET